MERPEGIIITISAGMLKEKGVRNWLKNFLQAMAQEDWLYYFRQGTIPRYADHLMYVYLCIGNKIRYRINFVEAIGSRSFTFDNEEGSIYGKAWIVTCGPVVKAPHDIPRKGFRGFRYTQTIF